MDRTFGMSRRGFMKTAAAVAAGLGLEWTGIGSLAAAVPGRADVPVVVIGAGLGGLTAAALLARNGFPVTLVEQHEKVGGYATTFDRAEGKYTFDVSLHATASARGSLKPVLEAAGVLDKVETVALPELCRVITPDHDFIWPPGNPDAVREEIVRLFPKEADGIRGFFADMMGILDEVSMPSDPDSSKGRAAFPETHPRMWACRNKTLADMLNDHLKDPGAQALLSIYAGYYGLPPSRLSGFYYCVATAAYLRNGGHCVKRRSQDLSDALRRSIEAAGGAVVLETEVEEIVTKAGKISGVRLDDGRTLEARAIISNASVPSTLGMLPKEVVPADYASRVAGYRPSISSFVVWLGLNGDVREKVKGYEVRCLRTYDVEQSFKAAMACDTANCNFGVTVYDNAYEGYSKPGTSTVSVIVTSGYDPWRRFEADYFDGKKEAYRKEKERIAGFLIDEAERMVIPGLKSMIDVVEIGTPLTNVRYTKNPEGAIYGFEQCVENAFMNRLGNKPPVPGLYFASAWTNPGGGYEPCLNSGAMAYKTLLGDLSA